MTQDTTLEGVQNFLDRKGLKEETLVEELKTMGPYKAFKLGFLLSTSDLRKIRNFGHKRP